MPGLIYQLVCPDCGTTFETAFAIEVEKLGLSPGVLKKYKEATGVEPNKIALTLKDSCPVCHPPFVFKTLPGILSDIPGEGG